MSQLPTRLTDVRHPTIAVADLSYPLYIPHRGGANIAPENTIDALRGAVELGFKLVEVDCSRLRDGGLMVMHDATADRTSNLHGPPSELLTAAVLRGRVNAGTWFGTSWPSDLLIPAFSDVLREVGNHICLLIEAKNPGSGAAAADLVTRHRLGHSVILISFDRAELTAGLAAGLPVGIVEPTGDIDLAALRRDGVDYLAVAEDAPEAAVTAAIEAGLTVFVYNVVRRHRHDRLRDLGVHGFITDDPMYLSRRLGPFVGDPYLSQTFWHGCLPSGRGDRGRFTPPNWWGFSDGGRPGGYRGALQGWACPIAGEPDADSFTISFDLAMDSLRGGDTSRFAAIFFCARSDLPFSDHPHPGAPDGYHALLRGDGELALFRVDGGRPAPLASVRTPAPALGLTVARIRVEVLPEEVTVVRTDVGAPNRVTVRDATHRGGYFHLGCDGLAARFRDVVVS